MTPNEAPATTKSYTLSSAPPDAHAAGRFWRRSGGSCRSWRPSSRASPSPLSPSSCRRWRGWWAAHHRARDRYLHPDRRLRRRAALRRRCCSAIYLAAFVATYVQTQTMGSVGRRVLFKLRNTLFTKLQQLPLDFFNQNKAGDLISRINNDTDKLNQFFSQSLVQLAGKPLHDGRRGHLPGRAQRPARSRGAGPGHRRARPDAHDRPVGQAEERQEPAVARRPERARSRRAWAISGSIVAFNRLDYFRQKFDEANERNFSASVASGLASNVFLPVYGLAFNLAQVVVLLYGLYLDRGGRADGRPADRLPAVRQQLLPAAAAAGGGLVVVPARARRPRPHLRGAGARIEHAGAAPA